MISLCELCADSAHSALGGSSRRQSWRLGHMPAVVLPLLVLALTGSAFQAGLVMGLNAIATIVISPIAGVLVDRWNRKVTMLLCDAGRTFVTLSIPLAFWLHILTMPLIYVTVLIAAVALGLAATIIVVSVVRGP